MVNQAAVADDDGYVNSAVVRSTAVTSLAVLAAAVLPAAARADSTTPDTSGASAAIGFLNQQRVANGIPAIKTIDNSYATAWCPDEDNGPSGGENSRVLAGSSDPEGFTATSSPWTDAPLHQAFLYDPLAQTAGYATLTNAPFDGGQPMPNIECMGLGNEASEPTTPTAYGFFAEAGPGQVPSTITVQGEGPFAPQQLVGIPEGTATGPQPILYTLGIGQVRATSWSLTDAATGATVPNVGLVTSYEAQAAGYDPYLLWNDSVLVPPPLQPGTVYDGQATFTGAGGVCVAETFSFATLLSDGSALGAQLAPLSAKPCPGTHWAGSSNSAGSGSSSAGSGKSTGSGSSTGSGKSTGSGSSTGSGKSTGSATSPGDLAIGPRHSALASRSGAVQVVAHWSRHSRLVIASSLPQGERLIIRQGHRTTTTRRRKLRLRWPYSPRITVWLTTASGQRSQAAVIRVVRG